MIKIKDYFQLVDYLKDNNFTVATAESCTGGLIAKLITDVAGSSKVFRGGVVSYSNEMKQKWLDVKTKTLNNYGAVSEETVSEMLDGIMVETGANIAIAVSGIAGPGGGTKDKPVGTVFIGISFNQKKVVEKYIFPGTRDDVRNSSANKTIEMIQDIVNSQRTKVQAKAEAKAKEKECFNLKSCTLLRLSLRLSLFVVKAN